jgi:hypothetical protein
MKLKIAPSCETHIATGDERMYAPLHQTFTVVYSMSRKMTGMFKSRGMKMSKISLKIEKVRIYIKAHLWSLSSAV